MLKTIVAVGLVLIGGQLGPRVQARVKPDKMKVLISWIFMGVGAFMPITLLGM